MPHDVPYPPGRVIVPSCNRLRAVALTALSTGVAAAIFAFDLTQPYGTGLGAFYVLPVLLQGSRMRSLR